MRITLFAAALLFAVPAHAQDSTSSLNAPASPSDVTAAIVAATPSPCTTPAPDTLNGSAGAASTCMPRADAARPTPVQAANTTLAADCTWSVVFSRAFTTSSPIIHASVVLASPTSPVPCIVTSRSATTQAGKCFPGQTTSLNLSIVTAGLTLAPFGSTCVAGTAVMVVGREATQ